MATVKQKKLAKVIAEELSNPNQTKDGKDLLVLAGYDETTALASPGRTIASKGVVSELKKLGFSQEGADIVVQSILYDKKEKAADRLNAADKIYKRLGSYTPEKSLNVNVAVEVDATVKELTEKLNALHRSPSISGDGADADPVGPEAQD